MTKEATKNSKIKSLMRMANYFYDQQHSMYLFLLAAIFNKPHWVLFFYGLTFPLIWLAKLIHEYRTGYKPYEYLLEPYKK